MNSSHIIFSLKMPLKVHTYQKKKKVSKPVVDESNSDKDSISDHRSDSNSDSDHYSKNQGNDEEYDSGDSEFSSKNGPKVDGMADMI